MTKKEGNKKGRNQFLIYNQPIATTHIQGECPCHDLYVKESYEDVLKMMEEALEQ